MRADILHCRIENLLYNDSLSRAHVNNVNGVLLCEVIIALSGRLLFKPVLSRYQFMGIFLINLDIFSRTPEHQRYA